MRYDIFELHPEMTTRQKAWRIGLLLVIIMVVAADLLVWRPN